MSSLTITNKRLIYCKANDLSAQRTEIPIKTISRMDAKFAKNDTFWAWVKLIIGIPLSVAIIGIFMIKSALNTIKSASLDIMFSTTKYIDQTIPYLGVSAIKGSPKKLNKFKLKVDKEKSRDMIEQLGAMILDAQNDVDFE